LTDEKTTNDDQQSEQPEDLVLRLAAAVVPTVPMVLDRDELHAFDTMFRAQELGFFLEAIGKLANAIETRAAKLKSANGHASPEPEPLQPLPQPAADDAALREWLAPSEPTQH
jgi:hypothetical protein